MTKLSIAAVSSLALLGLAACSDAPRSATEDATSPHADEAAAATAAVSSSGDTVATTTPGSPALLVGRSPEEQDAGNRLAVFLERAVLTSPEPVPDSLSPCEWQTDSVLALATYRVLSAARRGDTVHAATEVLTVAEEIAEPGVADRYIATLRVRRDTLHWRMTRHRDAGGWAVCGYSVEGWDFVRRGFDVSNAPVRWTPPGASWARARALVDSIRGQR